jgi:hypothetical protein
MTNMYGDDLELIQINNGDELRIDITIGLTGLKNLQLRLLKV